MSGPAGISSKGALRMVTHAKVQVPDHVLYETLKKLVKQLENSLVHTQIRVDQLLGQHKSSVEAGTAGWAYMRAQNRLLEREDVVNILEQLAKSSG